MPELSVNHKNRESLLVDTGRYRSRLGRNRMLEIGVRGATGRSLLRDSIALAHNPPRGTPAAYFPESSREPLPVRAPRPILRQHRRDNAAFLDMASKLPEC